MATYHVIGVGQHGKYFDENSYHDVTSYIFNPRSAVYVGGTGITSTTTAAEEMRQTAIHFGKDKGKRLRHSTLSFDNTEHVSPEAANEYAQKIIQFYAPEYQIAYSVHDSTDNVHIHFVMNQISYIDGHRYQGKKKDYYDFQHHMRTVTHLPILLVKDRNQASED